MKFLWRRGWDAGCCRPCPGPIQFAVRTGLDREPYHAPPLLPAPAPRVVVTGSPLAPPPLQLAPLPPHPSDAGLIQVADSMLSSLAVAHAECCICLEPLHTEPLATLTRGQRNACPHYLHARCAEELFRSESLTWAGEATPFHGRCPICREHIDGIARVPTLSEDVDRWFFCVDAEGDGRLSRQQVLDVLVAQFPIDHAKLEEAMPTLWERWDVDGSGYISKAELLDPDRGLMRFVRTALLREGDSCC